MQAVASRRALVAGNWKMNLLTSEAEALATELSRSRIPRTVDVVVCPTFTAIARVGSLLRSTGISIGAQDVFWRDSGASTGEVSADDLRSLGCRYVIVGHSERRREYQETNLMVNRKLLATLGHGLSPILCVGESAEERQRNIHHMIVAQQIHEALRSVPPPRQGQELAVAYEPIWAISPAGPADPEDAREMARVVHQALVDTYGETHVKTSTRILYGGSVEAENVRSFVDQETIHGVLVGAQSIHADDFRRILRALS